MHRIFKRLGWYTYVTPNFNLFENTERVKRYSYLKVVQFDSVHLLLLNTEEDQETLQILYQDLLLETIQLSVKLTFIFLCLLFKN